MYLGGFRLVFLLVWASGLGDSHIPTFWRLLHARESSPVLTLGITRSEEDVDKSVDFATVQLCTCWDVRDALVVVCAPLVVSFGSVRS